jgi:hypothetical protein
MFDIIDKLPVNNEELIIINSTTGLKRLNNLYKLILNEINNDDISIKYIYIQLKDGKYLQLKNTYFILNYFILRILVTWKLDFNEKFFIIKFPINKKVIGKSLSNIYTAMIDKYSDKYDNLRELACNEFWKFINELNIFSLNHTEEYCGTIDIFTLSKIKEDEDIKKICDTKLDKKENVKINELKLEDMKVQLTKILRTKYNDTLLGLLIDSGILNIGQIFHMFVKRGYGLKVSGKIIPIPSDDCYIEGIKDPISLKIEHEMSLRALVSNKGFIPYTQYLARRLQLVMTCIRRVYMKDCGSTDYITQVITEDNYKNYLGSYIEGTNGLILLSDDNIKKYIGKSINKRSVITCKAPPDGICEKCFGFIMEHYFNKLLTVGNIVTIEITEKVTQKILGGKHYSGTNSVTYNLNKEASLLFKIIKNNIFVKKTINRKNMKIGFDINECRYIVNLREIQFRSIDDINEFNFGRFSKFSIKSEKINVENVLLNNGKQKPILSKYFIMYVKNNYNKIKENNKVLWIPLDEFNINYPVFKMSILNDSTIAYAQSIEKFFETKIAEYTSATQALNDLSTLIYHKLDLNIAFIETILKGFLITNKYDLQVPIINDPNNVMFGNQRDINMRRCFGESLAFERMYEFLSNPLTYLVPKKIGLMDQFFSYE